MELTELCLDRTELLERENISPSRSFSRRTLSALMRSKSKKELVAAINHHREVNKLKWEEFGDRLDLLVKLAAITTLIIVLIIMFSKVVFT